MNVVSRFGSFGKEVSLRGDLANGWIDDFASISSTEPEGDFDHSTLASEGIMSLGIPESESSLSDPRLRQVIFISLVELVFDWDFDWKDVRPVPHVPKKPRQSRLKPIQVFPTQSFFYRNSTRSKGSISKFSGWNLCNRSMGTSKLSRAGANSY